MSSPLQEQKAPFVFDYGYHKGASLDEVGADWQGYGYIQYTASLNIAECVEWLKAHPERPEPSANMIEDYQLHFGKHKGKKLTELAKSYDGRSYLMYLSTWKEFSDRDIVKMYTDMFDAMPLPELQTDQYESWVFRFGKHRGERLVDIAQADPQYLRFMQRKFRRKTRTTNWENRQMDLQISHVLRRCA